MMSLLLRRSCPLLSFDSVEPPIAGLDVQAPTGKHRCSMDGRPQGEFPQEFPVGTIQRIEPSVIGTKVDPWANDHRCGHQGASGLKPPQPFTCQSMPGIQVAFDIADIERLGGHCWCRENPMRRFPGRKRHLLPGWLGGRGTGNCQIQSCAQTSWSWYCPGSHAHRLPPHISDFPRGNRPARWPRPGSPADGLGCGNEAEYTLSWHAARTESPP